MIYSLRKKKLLVIFVRNITISYETLWKGDTALKDFICWNPCRSAYGQIKAALALILYVSIKTYQKIKFWHKENNLAVCNIPIHEPWASLAINYCLQKVYRFCSLSVQKEIFMFLLSN